MYNNYSAMDLNTKVVANVGDKKIRQPHSVCGQ